jgi:hypothetical protein
MLLVTALMRLFTFLILTALVALPQTVVSASPSGAGIGLDPLIRIRFSQPLNPDAIREQIRIEWGATGQSDGFTTYPDGYRMAINRLAWDPTTNTLYCRPDDPLDHDRDYRLLYAGNVISRFHTQNVTQSILTRRLGPAGSLRRLNVPTINLSEVASLQTLSQTSTDPARPLTDTTLPVDVNFLTSLGLRRLVFLDFESSRGDRVAVHAWLPSGPKPPGGWPVTLLGHGFGDNRFSAPTLFSSVFISRSVVMAIDAVGHGYGPNSIMRLALHNGTTLDVPTQGRGRDLDRDGIISPGEGCILPTDFLSTCLRETALDYQKLVREIQNNIDLDGDRVNDLDPNTIHYLGQSLGAMYGTILLALEPGIEAGVLNVGGGSAVEIARTSSSFGGLLRELAPGGITDPLTPRYAPAQTLLPGQGLYLEFLDRLATAETPGAPASFAPFLKQATLYGNPIKRVLFQYAEGDQTVPNNANSQLIRAAYEYQLVSLYRHDLALQAVPTLPANPHAYLAAFAQLNQSSLLIALAGLAQAGQFLQSGLREVPDVNALVRPFFRQNLFETPTLLP